MWLTPRTLDIMAAYSIDEQRHLYHKTKLLKQAYETNDSPTLDLFKIPNKQTGIYEVFLEDSTRTKESFRNAIEFHGIEGKIFDTSSSSFNKHESYADTFNMLTGYDNQIFVVRSKLEGVCTWLDRNAKAYAARHQLPYTPLFINAGDGKHEHPTQEFLDQFSFLEQNNWDTSSIHIALIGDLLYGRTIHSKVEWLRIYDHVRVDLIAPEMLALPASYLEQMKSYGYQVRIFHSIDEYVEQSTHAPIWYFTRVQIERMGDDVLKHEIQLRHALTRRTDHMDKIDQDRVRFYHPLPRHKVTPELPTWVDDTPLNARERQSRNGMFVRIVLLAATAWVPFVCDDFIPSWVASIPLDKGGIKGGFREVPKAEGFDRIQEIQPDHCKVKRYSEWVHPITDWLVIDHIGRGRSIQQIKEHMTKIVSILWLYTPWGERISTSSDGTYKWLIFRPNTDITDKQIRKLAALAPWCTVNRIANQYISQKLRLSMPPKLYNLPQLSCQNHNCISHHSHHENIIAEFVRQKWQQFECIYCGQYHLYHEVRN
jgi:aspartate carbamoyltransferase